ncbi:hypothetical protein [Shinella zoogloeoides]|uniref:hypothetical protein n=1 Tax=Shinella zoogloeoides TaxID=352475 RepID=UPI00273E7D95|nr:hypothetical protein [Shinella zoogloeoides]WLR92145.1 hypothetical protein Q9316_17010 [Shinella zoogloeoides]
MNLDQAKALYPEIKSLLPLASPEWSESYNLREGIAEICIPNRFNGEVEPIAHILADCPYDDRRMMLKAPVYLNAVWVLLHEALRRIPREDVPAPTKKKIQTVAQACGRMCNDADFLRFLSVCHNVDTSDRERVANRVRTMIKVDSRAQLDTDEMARQRWFSLCDEFRSWHERNPR